MISYIHTEVAWKLEGIVDVTDVAVAQHVVLVAAAASAAFAAALRCGGGVSLEKQRLDEWSRRREQELHRWPSAALVDGRSDAERALQRRLANLAASACCMLRRSCSQGLLLRYYSKLQRRALAGGGGGGRRHAKLQLQQLQQPQQPLRVSSAAAASSAALLGGLASSSTSSPLSSPPSRQLLADADAAHGGDRSPPPAMRRGGSGGGGGVSAAAAVGEGRRGSPTAGVTRLGSVGLLSPREGFCTCRASMLLGGGEGSGGGGSVLRPRGMRPAFSSPSLDDPSGFSELGAAATPGGGARSLRQTSTMKRCPHCWKPESGSNSASILH